MRMSGFFRWVRKGRGAFVGAALGALAASAAWYCAALRTNFSSQPQGSFPGLEIHENDFLIPLNRLILTPFVFADQPDENGDWGRNRPATVLVFGIREGESTKYFLASGIQETTNLAVSYLGENILLEAAGTAGNGHHVIEYSTARDGLKHRCVAPKCLIVGSAPEAVNDISQLLKLNPDPENL